MADVTVIGRGSRVRGRITGEGDLEIAGHVEGDVDVNGDVTVADGGLVGSSINGRRVVVRGAVKGDLRASDAIALENGARVVGDLRAPRIAIAPGALVRGHVATEAGGSGAARASSARRAEAAPRRVEAPAAAPARRAEAPARAPAPPPARPAPAPAKSTRDVGKAAAPARKAPPAPVVPALRKGAKGALKKRAGG